jgi:Ca2+-binding EF-hand superfamily protein
VRSAAGTVNFDTATLAQVLAAEADITVTIGKAGALTEAQQTTVGAGAVYDLGLGSGGVPVTGDFAGTVTVSLPYAYPTNISPADYDDYDLKVYYLDGTGATAQVGFATYANGYATFTVPHFSVYYIMAEARTNGSDASVIVSLEGPSATQAGDDVAYRLYVEDAERLRFLKFTLEYTGLTFGEITGANGFDLFDFDSEDGIACLMASEQNGFTAEGPVLVATLGFTANESAKSASVLLKDIKASGYVSEGSSDSQWITVVPAQTSAQTEITEAPQYDAFDIDKNGLVNLNDLTTAAWYYRLTSNSPQWDDKADRADTDRSGTIELSDLIKIYKAVKTAN